MPRRFFYVGTFKDFDGNTYFTGSTYKTNTNWGAVAGSIITVPTVYGPFLFEILLHAQHR